MAAPHQQMVSAKPHARRLDPPACV